MTQQMDVEVGIVSVLTHHIRCFAQLKISLRRSASRSNALQSSRFLLEQSLTQLVVTRFQQFHLLWSAAAAVLACLYRNMSTTQFAAVYLILTRCLSPSLHVYHGYSDYVLALLPQCSWSCDTTDTVAVEFVLPVLPQLQ